MFKVELPPKLNEVRSVLELGTIPTLSILEKPPLIPVLPVEELMLMLFSATVPCLKKPPTISYALYGTITPTNSGNAAL